MNRKFIGIGLYLFLVFILIPVAIAVTGRKDLYYVLTSIGLLSIGSAGVWLTFYIGRINIGQGAYALMGGYVSAILVVTYGWSFWWTIPVAGLFCAFASVLIGIPILRLRGVYFAMVTLVLTEVVRLLTLALPVTGGAKGITSIPQPGPFSLFGITLIPDFAGMENPRVAFYFVAAVLMTLCFAGMYRLVHSRIGHICMSLQQNEELASSIGVNIAYLRVIAYSISSFLGGVSGAVFIAATQSVYPSSFTVTDSVNFMLNCFLGGLGYVFGPMLGTLVLYMGWNLLFETGVWQLLIYSSLMILLMLVLPNGILSLGESRRKR
jgi:branched-chain amino acid transport system permease protein